MSDLTGNAPADTYKRLLQVSAGGLTASAKPILDGDATESGLQISTAGATVPATKTMTVAGTLSVTGSFSSVGIDDQASSTTMTVDTAEVGINETNPEAGLHIMQSEALDPRPTLASGANELCLENGGANGAGMTIRADPAQACKIHFADEADTDAGSLVYDHSADVLVVTAATAECARFRANDILVGKTAQGIANAGLDINKNGQTNITADGIAPLQVNRLTDDGDLVIFYQASVAEGSISVSGNTVTYGNFSGHHTSQLAHAIHDPARLPPLAIGTVCDSIDEICRRGAARDRPRLPRFEVSTTAGSVRVYGVFMGWNEDGEALIAGLGAFFARVTGPCQNGDLLESAGDGTARVQGDDVVRSRTLGRVRVGAPGRRADEEGLVAVTLMCG